VSIQLGVDCIDCKALAPNVGDGGFLGAPVLQVRDKARGAGELMPSFGYFYEALAGIGIRPYDLVVLREFLVAHKGHRLQISEGNDVPEKKIFAAVKAQSEEKKRRTKSDEFREFVYEVHCQKCDESLASHAPELLQQAEPFSPSSENVSTFLKRWARDPDDGWNRGLMGIIDPYEPFMEELIDFMRSHRRHGGATLESHRVSAARVSAELRGRACSAIRRHERAAVPRTTALAEQAAILRGVRWGVRSPGAVGPVLRGGGASIMDDRGIVNTGCGGSRTNTRETDGGFLASLVKNSESER
jgi:hypothetical protein